MAIFQDDGSFPPPILKQVLDFLPDKGSCGLALVTLHEEIVVRSVLVPDMSDDGQFDSCFGQLSAGGRAACPPAAALRGMEGDMAGFLCGAIDN